MTRCRGCRGCRRRGCRKGVEVSSEIRGGVTDVRSEGPANGTHRSKCRLCPHLSSCRYGANDSLLEYCNLFDHIQISVQSWLSNYLTILILSHRHANQKTCSLCTHPNPVTVASKSIVSIAFTTTIDGSFCAPIDNPCPAHSHRLLTTVPEPLHTDRRTLTRSRYQLPLFQNRPGRRFSQ